MQFLLVDFAERKRYFMTLGFMIVVESLANKFSPVDLSRSAVATPFDKALDEIETCARYGDCKNTEADIELCEGQCGRRPENDPRIISQVFVCHSLNVLGSYLGYRSFVVGEFPVSP